MSEEQMPVEPATPETTSPVSITPPTEPQKSDPPAPKAQKAVADSQPAKQPEPKIISPPAFPAEGSEAGSAPLLKRTKSGGGIIWATGRRKTSVAQLRMVPSKNGGKILVNKKSLEQFFHGMEKLTINALESLRAAKFPGSYNFFIKVHGGGIHGQSDAIRHAIARALSQLDPKTKQLMRKEGYLTRDPRVVERKKSGQPKSRKRFQYSKR